MQNDRMKGGRFTSLLKTAGLSFLSLVCAAALAYMSVASAVVSGVSVDPRSLLLIGVVSGVVLLAVMAALSFLRAARSAKMQESRNADEVNRLKRRLHAAESILRSEPQVLIFWESSGEPQLKVHTLPLANGVPGDPNALLRFRSWLEPNSASELEGGLNALFQSGKPFNLMLKTASGNFVETSGLASGGRLIMRIRDLMGQKKELAAICDQQRRQAQVIASKHALLDAIPFPIWFRDEDNRIEWANKAYLTSVEAANLDDVMGNQIEFLESRQRKSVEDVLVRGETFHEKLHTIIGGERRVYDTIVLPLGKQSAGIAIDEVALETAKGALDQHIAAHSRTLDRVSTAIAIFGPDQRLSFYNQAYVSLWQLDPAWLDTAPRDGEILDRLREGRSLPEEADYRAWKERQLTAYQSPEVREDWWHLPNGRSLFVVAEQRPDGGVTYLYDDATERLALESKYNALFHVQRETLENLREAVAVFATDGRLTLFNGAFAQMWRLSIGELEQGPHVDRIIQYCRVLHDDGMLWMNVKRAVTAFEEQRKPLDGQLSRSDGSVMAYTCLPLPDGATLLTFVDITDSKRVERVLIERNEALEVADRMKNDFLQNVSYELRTPLTNIIGFSDLLATEHVGHLNEKQTEYLGDIRGSSGILLTIIDNILDLATIDAGALELKIASIKVEDVIKAAALAVRDRLVRAKLGLDVQVDRNAVTLFADEKRVTQVLYNLLSNAIGFSPEGGRVTLSCTRDAGMICFTVKDQGPGMDKEYQKAMFERFESRAQGSRHRGAGLGLSIVKSLVELHGGGISVNSAPGEGTSVTVRFPESGILSEPYVSPAELASVGETMRSKVTPPPLPQQAKSTSNS